MTVRGTARGRTIELDEPLPYPSGQELTLHVQPVAAGAPVGSAAGLGSPARLLEIVRRPPCVSPQDAAELESAIRSGRLAADDRGIFDDIRDSE